MISETLLNAYEQVKKHQEERPDLYEKYRKEIDAALHVMDQLANLLEWDRYDFDPNP